MIAALTYRSWSAHLSMVTAPSSLPLLSGRAAVDDFERVVDTRAGVVRASLDDVLARRDAAFPKHAQLVKTLVGDMVGLLTAGHDVDVDQLIDNFYRDEQEYVEARDKIKKSLDRALKSPNIGREDVVVLNCSSSELIKRLNAMARLHRDARWALMAARAEHQPSEGVGQIKGQGEPVD